MLTFSSGGGVGLVRDQMTFGAPHRKATTQFEIFRLSLIVYQVKLLFSSVNNYIFDKVFINSQQR